MNKYQFIPIAVMFFAITFVNIDIVSAAPFDGWGIGEQSPDFQAQYLSNGNVQTTSWYQELNSDADVYVLSTCAMWCPPCQQFAADSQSIVDAMANQGIDVRLYDFVFQDPLMLEPDQADIQNWIDSIWTASEENVWYGEDIPISSPNSVIVDIFTTYNSNAIPNILFLDRNLVVAHQFEGYTRNLVEDAIVSTAQVPEPGGTVMCFGLIALCIARRKPFQL